MDIKFSRNFKSEIKVTYHNVSQIRLQSNLIRNFYFGFGIGYFFVGYPIFMVMELPNVPS